MEKFPCGIFSCNLRFRFFFCEPSSPQHNEDNTYYHILTHAHTTKHNHTQTNTNKHNQTQTNTNTSPISSTGRPTSFQVARGLHRCMIRTSSAIQGMSQSTGTLTLWQVRAVCAQIEPDWTSDHCHCCCERRETTRAIREKRKREEKVLEIIHYCLITRVHTTTHLSRHHATAPRTSRRFGGSSSCLDESSHPWVPAGHPQYTGASTEEGCGWLSSTHRHKESKPP